MKNLEIEIPEYSSEQGFRFSWEDDFVIETHVESSKIHLRANESGLISLAKILLTLSQPEVMENCHVHLDEFNSLEDGSVELIIEKI